MNDISQLSQTKLKILRAAISPSRYTDLAKASGVSKTMFDKHLDDLVEKGLIRKTEDGLYVITDKGLEILGMIELQETNRSIIEKIKTILRTEKRTERPPEIEAVIDSIIMRVAYMGKFLRATLTFITKAHSTINKNEPLLGVLEELATYNILLGVTQKDLDDLFDYIFMISEHQYTLLKYLIAKEGDKAERLFSRTSKEADDFVKNIEKSMSRVNNIFKINNRQALIKSQYYYFAAMSLLSFYSAYQALKENIDHLMQLAQEYPSEIQTARFLNMVIEDMDKWIKKAVEIAKKIKDSWTNQTSESLSNFKSDSRTS